MKDEEQTYENFQSINDLINMKSEDNTPKKRKRLIKNAQKKVKEEEIDHNDIEEESHDNILDDEAEGLIDNEEENYSNSLHSISESEPEEEEERPAKLTKKKRKRGKEKKSKKGKKKFMSDLLLREADEDEDDEEEEDGDGEITNWERDKLMKEMMGPKLKPRSENIYDQ